MNLICIPVWLKLRPAKGTNRINVLVKVSEVQAFEEGESCTTIYLRNRKYLLVQESVDELATAMGESTNYSCPRKS